MLRAEQVEHHLVEQSPTLKYCVYGLTLRSQWPLACPPDNTDAPPTVELLDGVPRLFEAAARRLKLNGKTEWFQHLRLEDGSSYLRWKDQFEFVVSSDGHRISGRPVADAPEEVFQNYLLSQVLSFALLRQGIEPLHATTVVIEGSAVGFLGDSGCGKSSLGATFLREGYPLLTDDLLVLQRKQQEIIAFPGPPRIKLYREVAGTLFGKQAQGTPLNQVTDKMILPLNDRQAHSRSAPLRALYVLNPPNPKSRPSRIQIRRLAPRQALLALLKNTFNTIEVHPERLQRQFQNAARLAQSVPIRRLSYPRSLDQLPAVREAVLSDLAR